MPYCCTRSCYTVECSSDWLYRKVRAIEALQSMVALLQFPCLTPEHSVSDAVRYSYSIDHYILVISKLPRRQGESTSAPPDVDLPPTRCVEPTNPLPVARSGVPNSTTVRRKRHRY